MKNFFNPDNFLWQWFGKLADFFLISCMWLLTCIPLVTAVPACIALYDTVAHCVRHKEPDMFRRFLRTFKNELGRGILMTLLWVLIGFLLNAGYQVLVQMAAADSGWQLFSVVYFITLLLPLGTACWAIAIESRFSYSFGQLHRMALLFTLGHLPQTLAISLLLVLAMNVVMRIPFLVMFIPGLAVTLQSLFIEKVFQQHMAPQETE